MLEEQFAKQLIKQGAHLSIWELEFNDKFNFKGTLGPFKTDFSLDKTAKLTSILKEAVTEGEGWELKGKDALKLLQKVNTAYTSGVLSEYALIIDITAEHCDFHPLFLTDEGLRVDYTREHWEKELEPICVACKQQTSCPSYQAQITGKVITYGTK